MLPRPLAQSLPPFDTGALSILDALANGQVIARIELFSESLFTLSCGNGSSLPSSRLFSFGRDAERKSAILKVWQLSSEGHATPEVQNHDVNNSDPFVKPEFEIALGSAPSAFAISRTQQRLLLGQVGTYRLYLVAICHDD